MIKAKACINVIYDDPDISDKKLYVDLAKKLKVFGISERPENQVKKIYGAYTLSYTIEGKTINISSDAVCGWKQLYILRKGDISWLDDYKEMREYTAAYLIWPKHNVPTINTLRFTVFKDRVDSTLFDVKRFFDCKKNMMKTKMRSYLNQM